MSLPSCGPCRQRGRRSKRRPSFIFSLGKNSAGSDSKLAARVHPHARVTLSGDASRLSTPRRRDAINVATLGTVRGMEITVFYKVNADNTVTARTPTGVRTYSDWASFIQAAKTRRW